jgi:hypothetical protein
VFYLNLFLITLAFISCAVLFGIIIGDTSAPVPNNYVYHYQTLISAIVALLVCFVGGGYILKSTRMQRSYKKKDFISEQMQILIDAHSQLKRLDLMADADPYGFYKDVMQTLEKNIKSNKIFRLVGEEEGAMSKELIYESRDIDLTPDHLEKKKSQILNLYALLSKFDKEKALQ